MKINNSLKKKNNSVNERSEIKPFTTRVPQVLVNLKNHETPTLYIFSFSNLAYGVVLAT